MKMISLEEELKGNAYPGRGIVIGKSQDGKKAVTAYFIMGQRRKFTEPCIYRDRGWHKNRGKEILPS